MSAGFKKGLISGLRYAFTRAAASAAVALGLGASALPAEAVTYQYDVRESVNTTTFSYQSNGSVDFVSLGQGVIFGQDIGGDGVGSIQSDYNPFTASSEYGLFKNPDNIFGTYSVLNYSGSVVRAISRDLFSEGNDGRSNDSGFYSYDGLGGGWAVELAPGQNLTLSLTMEALDQGNVDGRGRSVSAIVVTSGNDYYEECSADTGVFQEKGPQSFLGGCQISLANDTAFSKVFNVSTSVDAIAYNLGTGSNPQYVLMESPGLLPAVPEPSAYGMMLAGGAVLAAAMRRRSNKAANANAQGGVSGPAASMG